MPQPTDQFYHDLPANRMALADLLVKASLFHPVPANWHVIITDIKGSTQAVQSGLHETVNLIATGSIVTVLNLAFRAGITVPFFFGGDGATFIVPPSIVDQAMQGLLLYQLNTSENFNLELRVGVVPVQEIYEEGHELNISKFSLSDAFSIPVILGKGLSFAEQLIKAEDYLFTSELAPAAELDLSGMQCRWDKIDPPEHGQEIVTLLIMAVGLVSPALIFSKVIRHIDEIYGPPQKRQPISVAKLKLKSSFDRLSVEMRARIGKIRFFELLKSWLINLYGYIYFQTESGKNYLNRLVEMSDTLVMDGRINTVISGNQTQRFQLLKALDELEQAGEVLYGVHVSGDSVMSCYVRDLKDGHIHFVDGAEGGYTQAARQLKAKLIHKI
ncbi:Protein of unknown function [Pedobacter steynii]|uniref:DUF3095 domain-containing protein n=1 Tax=Pedobacter steynii TaxID=430522 RepID=A0A1G9N4S0_9SPHI|nr:DUF3095 domain-containing protein [Pedobacter steynii]NQX39412.1 DUF3095 domain-containing protein [Pedobacter steynii]SDL81394.1 Protein of unknown function [Pedobacter steynii]